MIAAAAELLNTEYVAHELAVAPQEAVTVKQILYKPAVEYWCAAYKEKLLTLLSPQLHEAVLTFQGYDGIAVQNCGVLVGTKVKFALATQGMPVTLTVLVIVLAQLEALLAIKVT
jgi:hypothetical protein